MSAEHGDRGPQREEQPAPQYSVVIPVFNSERLVGQVIDRTVAFFEQQDLSFEVVLVNDGSSDGSWEVIEARAQADPRVVAVNLLTNYGQHTALLCGMRESRGEWVATIDDDLQNPPEELVHLFGKAAEGHDLVLGRFREKKHALYRRWGSLLVSVINTRVFGKPPGLVLTNYRLMHRSVVDRVCAYRSVYPYVTGLSLMYSHSPANVLVEHQARPEGRSNYNLIRITKLMMRILFAYSAFPLRMVVSLGALVSVVSFGLGVYYLVRSLLGTVQVQGWTTLVVLLSFFNGINLLMLGMLGEYVVRILNQTSNANPYEVKAVVRGQA